MNKNLLCDLSLILGQIHQMMPALVHLSLLGNVICTPRLVNDQGTADVTSEENHYRM